MTKTSMRRVRRNATGRAALDAASLYATFKKWPRTPTRTTMRYDRARVSLDRHATYTVAACLAGATR